MCFPSLHMHTTHQFRLVGFCIGCAGWLDKFGIKRRVVRLQSPLVMYAAVATLVLPAQESLRGVFLHSGRDSSWERSRTSEYKQLPSLSCLHLTHVEQSRGRVGWKFGHPRLRSHEAELGGSSGWVTDACTCAGEDARYQLHRTALGSLNISGERPPPWFWKGMTGVAKLQATHFAHAVTVCMWTYCCFRGSTVCHIGVPWLTRASPTTDPWNTEEGCYGYCG